MAERSAGILVSGAVLAIGGVALAAGTGQFWLGQPESIDRLLIPLVSVWLIRRRASSALSTPSRWGLALIAPAAVLGPTAWYLYAQVGPRPLLLWWWAVTWLAAVAGWVVTARGWGRLWELAFPLSFLLFALPTPSAIQVPLQARLQDATTTVAATALPWLGVPTERSGYVLRIPSGELGVVEACSGVRSVTAMVAVAALVAYLGGYGLVRGAALVALALPVIVLSNALRVTLTGVLQEAFGNWVAVGTSHEVLGIVTLLLGLGGVLAIGGWLRPRTQTGPASPPVLTVPRPRVAWLTAGLLATVAFMCGAAAVAGGQLVTVVEDVAPLDRIPLTLGEWVGEDIPIDPEIASILALDRAIYRTYRSPSGARAQAWVIYWTAASAVKGYHHPDVCWPSRGWIVEERGEAALPLPGGGEVRLTSRRFDRDGQRQLIWYWTQEGDRVWTDSDEATALAGADSYRWVADLLTRREVRRRSSRLVVLVGSEVWGDHRLTETTLAGFTTQLAEALYDACPWARPAAPAP